MNTAPQASDNMSSTFHPIIMRAVSYIYNLEIFFSSLVNDIMFESTFLSITIPR